MFNSNKLFFNYLMSIWTTWLLC